MTASALLAATASRRAAIHPGERLLFWALVLLVALMPLPFGSARPWAWSAAALATGLLALGYAVLLLSARLPLRLAPRRLALPAFFFLPPVAWALYQALALPPAALAHPVWAEAAGLLGPAVAPRVGVEGHAALTALMRLLTHATVFLLAVQLCRAPGRARLAVAAIALAGGAYALYAILALVFAPERLLWFGRWAYLGDATGTFVNRNSYATYAGLGLLAALTLLADHLRRAAAADGGRVALARLLRSFAETAWLPATAAVALLSAVLLTHSRGGFLSAAGGVLVLLLCLVAAGRLGRLGRWAIAGFALAAALLILAVSADVTLERLSRTVIEQEERLFLYERVLAGIADRPWLGHGFGSFDLAYRAYNDSAIWSYYDKAHSDYLEAAFELGLPAALSLWLAILAAALVCLAGLWRRRRDRLYPALGVAATVLIALHAAVDFSLQMPAVAATYAFLLGLAYGQSWSTREGKGA